MFSSIYVGVEHYWLKDVLYIITAEKNLFLVKNLEGLYKYISCLFHIHNMIIPDICHLDHLHVGGEEICHVEKFQISIHGISPHEEEFQFFHTTDVEKCEFLPNLVKFHISPQDRCEEI